MIFLIRKIFLFFLAFFGPMWVRFPEQTYYLQGPGSPAKDFTRIESETYYFDPASYEMQTGWLDLDGSRYYFADDGAMQTGICSIDGRKYCFRRDGKMHTGWFRNGNTYFFREDGQMLTGWTEIDGAKLFFSEDGIMQTGMREIDGGTYYFAGNGAMQTGWQDMKDGKRYFDPDSGRMCTGWLDLGGRRYLMNNGIMATGWLNIDGIDYYFDKDGNVCIGKTYSEGDSAFYYLFPDGGYARNVSIDGLFYGGDGKLQYLTDDYYTDGRDVYIDFQSYPLYGRLYIPDVNISVGLGYIGDVYHGLLSQQYVDMQDMAAYLDFQDFGDDSVVIADHKHQGFERIKKCTPGMRAYVKTDDDFRIYECYDIGNGYNDYDNVYDRDGNNIYCNGHDTLSLYTCNADSHHVTIVKFVRVDTPDK